MGFSIEELEHGVQLTCVVLGRAKASLVIAEQDVARAEDAARVATNWLSRAGKTKAAAAQTAYDAGKED